MLFAVTRLVQVLKYGWIHAGKISEKEKTENSYKRIWVYLDIMRCYFKYGLWSNQYMSMRFYSMNKKERKIAGEQIRKQNRYKAAWVKAYFEEIKFLSKYADIKYDASLSKRRKKIKAYTKKYNLGKGAYIEYNVSITKQHYSDSKMSSGKNLLLARNVDFDYTGNVTIGDNVAITEGVKILTHAHDPYFFVEDERIIPFSNRAYKTELVIEDNVRILSHAVILPTVNRIGKNSVVSAGSVVTKNVPENAIVSGNPARVILIKKKQ